MEIQSPSPENGEKLKYQPKYMVLLGRHAEKAGRSIFDQVGGESGIRSDNFEESSLTLKGIIEASMLDYDLLGQLLQKMPQQRLKFIFAHTGAYRTKETVELIREKLKGEAQEAHKEVEIVFEDVKNDDCLTETPDEDPQKSVNDISSFVDRARAESAQDDGVILFGITHEAKLRNFLEQSGIKTDEVKTSEFLTLTDAGDGKSNLAFRDEAVVLSAVQDRDDASF